MSMERTQLPRRSENHKQNTRAVQVISAFILVLLMLAAPGAQLSRYAAAQNIGQRIVTGTVVNDAGTVQAGAVVFLKNLKTKAIRSFTTTADGTFRFAQVNMTEDHEVWAEMNGKKSAVKTVSSWDTRKQFDCELKLK